MHAYRTHNCGELRAANAGIEARLSGWVHRKRDHGNLLFVDLRDHFGLTQCVIEVGSTSFQRSKPCGWKQSFASQVGSRNAVAIRKS